MPGLGVELTVLKNLFYVSLSNAVVKLINLRLINTYFKVLVRDIKNREKCTSIMEPTIGSTN